MMAPASLGELAEAVRSMPHCLAVGAETKPRLSAADVPKLSMKSLSGIVEYDPSEFTFTALAGTSIREIAATLAKEGQYLPFDPMLVEAGATLGGTVASGLSGPGRFRYGGLRDFILGVRFVDGLGRLLRMGGKVVKNAAGFDLPKFFVGSLGRFGVLAEMTFKVFPSAPAARTLRLTVDSPEAAVQVLTEAANSRWEAQALDLLPDGRNILLRLAAPEPALDALSKEILARWSGQTLSPEEARESWASIGEFCWAPAEACLLKAGITPDLIPKLYGSIPDGCVHVSAGGNVAFLAVSSDTAESTLRKLGLEALTLRGNAPLWVPLRRPSEIERAVKTAVDPENRFPSLD
ncbi:MAG TPA: FAD-binding protein [Chthoniobacteraceae bacterium]|jgi:glycolate oxidase FAD binding subunit